MASPPGPAPDARLWAREELASICRKHVKMLVEDKSTAPRERDVLYMELDKLLHYLNVGAGYNPAHGGRDVAELVMSGGNIRGARVVRVCELQGAPHSGVNPRRIPAK